jgi:hypothetical protein
VFGNGYASIREFTISVTIYCIASNSEDSVYICAGLRIQLLDNDYLSLAEVQVMGVDPLHFSGAT